MRSKKEIIQKIRVKLFNNQEFLEWAIVAIYKNQTSDEKYDRRSKYRNAVGFNKPDAGIMSYYAKWILSGNVLTGGFLSDAKERMIKYCSQLADIPETLAKLNNLETAKIDGKIIVETPKALLLELDPETQVWFPKSTIVSKFQSVKEISQSFIIDKKFIDKKLGA
ncbi:MAG: hypothetical protein ACFFDN_08040 [Candidatus Hodarchaeota archaeon]